MGPKEGAKRVQELKKNQGGKREMPPRLPKYWRGGWTKEEETEYAKHISGEPLPLSREKL